jgi:hypothetical protein
LLVFLSLLNLARRTGHHGRVPKVDDDQLAALRRLRVAFGFVEVVEVISHDPAAARMKQRRGRGWPTQGG